MVKVRRIPIVLTLVAGGLALLATALGASAAPLAVARSYPGAAPCATTLQACINGSAAGDQINIAANTYVTSFTLNKAVSLVGANTNTTILRALTGQRVLTVTSAVTNGTQVSNLTLQGTGALASGNGGVVWVQAGAQPTLQNLTIQTGTVTATSAFGGGLFTEVSLTLTNVQFINNTAFNGFGGGLASGPGAHLTLVNSTFRGNIAKDEGGGLFAAGNATLSGGTLTSNQSTTQNGGAMSVGGNLLLNGTVITGSLSFDSGGGIFVTGTTTINNALIAQNWSRQGAGGGLRAAGTAHINSTDFISNTSFNQGGGLRVNGAIVLTNTMFMSNTSGAGGGNPDGGGLDAVANATITGGSFIANTTPAAGGGARVLGTLVLSGTAFRNNQAGTAGGGLHVNMATVQNATFNQNQVLVGSGGGLAAANVLSITRSVFTQNAANSGNFADGRGGGMDAGGLQSTWDQFRGNFTGPQGSGGGLFVAGVFDLDGGLFFTNTARAGGGLGVDSNASGFIENSLFARNVVTFTDGGAAMRLMSLTSVVLTHNTLVGTSAPNRAAVLMQGSTGDFSFFANIISHHTRGLQQNSNGPTSTVSAAHTVFSSVSAPYIGPIGAGGSDITGTVLYRNAAADDYHLVHGSVAIDYAPFYGLDTDFEGEPRPMGITPAANYDSGFDEALPARIFLPLLMR